MGFLLSMSNYPGYTDSAAFFVMFYALLKLGVYNKYLNIAKYISFVVMTVGIAGIMLALGELIGFVDPTNMYINAYDNASEALKLVYGILLFFGVIHITVETNLPKLTRLGGFVLCADVLSAVLFILSFFFPWLLPWRMLLRVVYMLSGAYLLFSCYRMICLEGDEDMPIPESRFGIVNELRRRLDEKAERGNRRGEEIAEYKRRQAESRQCGVDVNRKFTESKKKK